MRAFPGRCACGRPGLLAVPALLLSVGCASVWPGALGPLARTRLDLQPSNRVVSEGQSVVLRLSRDRAEGALPIRLAVRGEATFGRDYLLGGLDPSPAGEFGLTMADGDLETEIRLEILDDVVAEAEEGVTVTIRDGPGYRSGWRPRRATVTIPGNDFVVTQAGDRGEGSLRQAMHNANALGGSPTITFDPTVGPFAAPQTIRPKRPLPVLSKDVTIDGRIPDRLWVAHGVIVSGSGERRVFEVGRGARVTLRALAVTEGFATTGGGVLSRGTLVIRDCTLAGNTARRDGGGVANLGGELFVINSTLVSNHASRAGGGVATEGGTTTVTNSTFAANGAGRGGGLLSSGRLLLRNTILADSTGGGDCIGTGGLDPRSTHNIIEVQEGCGTPASTADPRLGSLASYNGPTPTIPPGAGSFAINNGHNPSAVDDEGHALEWDQRGNGDPRFVAGFTDIGAFEHQAFPKLEVDTPSDAELRACTQAPDDCSLRGALRLVAARGEPATIRFDPRVFGQPVPIILERPLPEITSDLILDAGATGGVLVRADGFPVFVLRDGAEARFLGVIPERRDSGFARD